VYLPAGASWADAWSGEVVSGGTWVEANAPLERIPVYLRDGAKLSVR
jgi:alpha-D-xyloside xylohydrolase